MPPHALLKCNAISQGGAGGSWVKQPFPSQALLNTAVKSQLRQAPLPPAAPLCLALRCLSSCSLHHLPSSGADGPKPGSPYLPEVHLQRKNRDFKTLEVAAGLTPTPVFIAYRTGTGSDGLSVYLWDTLALCSAAKARHLQMFCGGVHRLSATAAGSQVNQIFEAALPRPSLYHQLSKDDQQGFKSPKLVILERKLE